MLPREQKTRRTYKSKYWNGDPRKCKYCDNPAKRNITPDGDNKGYYKTCGKQKCLTAQYRDMAVNAQKCCSITKICEYCNKPYQGKSQRQRWCFECVPNSEARARMQRYGLSELNYRKMLIEQDNLCYLCREKFPRCVDHGHKSNKIRKLLCDGCNTKLAAVDNREWLEKALTYINEFGE